MKLDWFYLFFLMGTSGGSCYSYSYCMSMNIVEGDKYIDAFLGNLLLKNIGFYKVYYFIEFIEDIYFI